MTPLLEGHIKETLQDYANIHRFASEERITANLLQMGHAIGRSSIHRYLEQMDVKTKTQYIKPMLSEKHKLARLKYVLDKVDTTQKGMWVPQLETIHVDESWFYMRQLKYKLKVSADTILPEAPSTQHKSHIKKVLFVVAMARPQKDFDGKI